MSCARTRQLLDAWIDDELDPTTADEIGRHIAACPGCAELRAEREALSRRLRNLAPRFTAPPALRESVRAQLHAAGCDAGKTIRPRTGPTWWQAAAMGGVAAGVAVLTTYWMLRIAPDDSVREQTVNRHVAALTLARADPARLVDVASTDRHEVKPWFEGRIDFSPPVRDLAAQGFVLLGGRVDEAADGRTAAVVYRIRQHTVELFVSRAAVDSVEAPRSSTLRGFGVVTWAEGGLRFAAVSDVDPRDLQRFAEAVRSPS